MGSIPFLGGYAMRTIPWIVLFFTTTAGFSKAQNPEVCVVKPKLNGNQITWTETRTVYEQVFKTRQVMIEGKVVTESVTVNVPKTVEVACALEMDNCIVTESSGKVVPNNAKNIGDAIAAAKQVVVIQGVNVPGDFVKLLKEGILVIAVKPTPQPLLIVPK